MIEVTELRKRFGPVRALDGMTFTAHPGRVTGFAGPNGAGKSTTMRVILGLDRPDSGTATVGGRPYRSLEHPLRQVGSLLDASALAPSRSARARGRASAWSPSGPGRRSCSAGWRCACATPSRAPERPLSGALPRAISPLRPRPRQRTLRD
jgi:ABC-2 type transport system ATP-binding protein